MRNTVLIPLLAILVCISGCGTFYDIVPEKSHSLSELTGYDKVIVLDFKNHTDSKKPEVVEIGGKYFADKITKEIIDSKLFNEVSRERTPGKAIVVGGTIYKYVEGDAFLRLMVGFGAGSSSFKAYIAFVDNDSNTRIAYLKVNQTSWALGGMLAEMQTVYYFMDEEAKKVARDLVKIKTPKK